MTEIINNLSLNECSRCKKILRESELIVTKYWKCDDCMTIDLKEKLDKNPQVKMKFLNESTAKEVIDGLKEHAKNNGSLSLNELDEIFTNSYGKK